MDLSLITKHWAEISQIIAAIVVIATVVVGMTPSEADNKIVNRIIDILARFSILKRDEGIVEK